MKTLAELQAMLKEATDTGKNLYVGPFGFEPLRIIKLGTYNGQTRFRTMSGLWHSVKAHHNFYIN